MDELWYNKAITNCNMLMYICSSNTSASGDSPLAQLVVELDLCLFLCVTQSPWDRLPAEPINNLSLPTTHHSYCV